VSLWLRQEVQEMLRGLAKLNPSLIVNNKEPAECRLFVLLWHYSNLLEARESELASKRYGGWQMLGIRFARLIEHNSEKLAAGLVVKLQESERTRSYREIPASQLQHQLQDLYQNLSLWLTTKTDTEIEHRYHELGKRRAEQGVPLPEFAWAVIVAKEHLWVFLQREAMADQAYQLLSELDFLLLLEQFFDRALYYSITAYNAASKEQVA